MNVNTSVAHRLGGGAYKLADLYRTSLHTTLRCSSQGVSFTERMISKQGAMQMDDYFTNNVAMRDRVMVQQTEVLRPASARLHSQKHILIDVLDAP